MSESPSEFPKLPADDLTRSLSIARADDAALQHIGLVGDNYTITVTGKDTNSRFCVISMYVPPGGGPPPHRHDFEETFFLLEGEMQVTLRGETSTVQAGDVINVPSNAPHQFHNASLHAVRMICICSPAGNDEFFREVGVPVATRTTPPPKLDGEQMVAFLEKVKTLAPKYRTELLDKA
jgi:quercetin dioxygenase-like cupin family protein